MRSVAAAQRRRCRSPSTATVRTTAARRRPTSTTSSSRSTSRRRPATSVCRHPSTTVGDSTPTSTRSTTKTPTSVRTPRSPRSSRCRRRGSEVSDRRRRRRPRTGRRLRRTSNGGGHDLGGGTRGPRVMAPRPTAGWKHLLNIRATPTTTCMRCTLSRTNSSGKIPTTCGVNSLKYSRSKQARYVNFFLSLRKNAL